jgi:hypothetical protein
MFIQFTKNNFLITLILGFIITIILNQYYYGGMTMIYALFIGIQIFMKGILQENKNLYTNKNLLYTSIPAYTFLLSIILTSFYILYKSKTVKIPQIIFTISQLIVSGSIFLFLRFMKGRYPILNGSYINYVPTLFFLGFLISVSIIKDNQDILRHTYSQIMYDVKGATTEEY